MSTTFNFLSQGGASLATAAIVNLWLNASPRLSIPRAALMVAESIILAAAFVSHQLEWNTLPELIFNGIITAACAIRLVQFRQQRSPEDTPDYEASSTSEPEVSPPRPAEMPIPPSDPAA